jgi:hypothetical protein
MQRIAQEGELKIISHSVPLYSKPGKEQVNLSKTTVGENNTRLPTDAKLAKNRVLNVMK